MSKERIQRKETEWKRNFKERKMTKNRRKGQRTGKSKGVEIGDEQKKKKMGEE